MCRMPLLCTVRRLEEGRVAAGFGCFSMINAFYQLSHDGGLGGLVHLTFGVLEQSIGTIIG